MAQGFKSSLPGWADLVVSTAPLVTLCVHTYVQVVLPPLTGKTIMHRTILLLSVAVLLPAAMSMSCSVVTSCITDMEAKWDLRGDPEVRGEDCETLFFSSREQFIGQTNTQGLLRAITSIHAFLQKKFCSRVAMNTARAWMTS